MASKVELNKEQKEALKEFDEQIKKCPCGICVSGKYCDNCKSILLKFMDKWGMGLMLHDVELYNIKKEYEMLLSENKSLKLQLKNKTKDYERIKNG